MNCKKGDLAICVAAYNTGAMVECLDLLQVSDAAYSAYGMDWWVVRALSSAYDYARNKPLQCGEISNCPDSALRPLRGDIKGEEDLYSLPKEAPRETIPVER